jgi:predicted patatin/cPLA2 family phospholipase
LDSFISAGFDPFDIYIGVSGGSMCMSYYISQQYKATYNIMSSIYSDDKFISLKQLFATEGYVNLQYLENYALEHHPLNLKKVLDRTSNALVEVVATDMANGNAVYIQPEFKNWHKSLRASSTLPFLTRGYCMFEDKKLMDGGWSDPIPVKRAVELGADKVIVIRTLPAEKKLEWSYFGWFGGLWHRENPGLSKRFSEDHVYYNESIDYIAKNPKEVSIIQIAPENNLATGSYSTSKAKIDQDYRLGLDQGLQFINEFRHEFE